ncbi:hypothetical protein [Larkinella harenae]
MQSVHKGMIYPPESVAILLYAEHSKREVFVGSQAKQFAVVGTVVPQLVDKIMDVWMCIQSKNHLIDPCELVKIMN